MQNLLFVSQDSCWMDPTKPILDLYQDSNNYSHQRSSYRSAKFPSVVHQHTRPAPHKDISYSELKQKYQKLYQAYCEKQQKINAYEEQLDILRSENSKLKQQIYRVEEKNEQLNATVLNKNVELQEAYRQIQEDIRRGNKAHKNDQALYRFEEGLREAITSNFNLLREAALSELKQF